MSARRSILTIGILLWANGAAAQLSAGDALRAILFEDEGGALTANTKTVLYELLLDETTMFPTGTSAGGFTWSFDDTLRVPVRRNRSFGPMFAERPFTTGKGRLNVGAAFQHTTFSSVGGVPITNIETSTRLATGEVYSSSSSLNVQLDRTIVSATYGLHDRIDVAAIVPLGSSRVSGYSRWLTRVNGVEDSGRNDSSGSSFGIGDILLRTKVAVIASEYFDAAAAIDIRLPSGDPEKLLGTGFTQARVMFIGGTTVGTVNPHVNLGYTFGGDGMTFGPDTRFEDAEGDPELIDRQSSAEFNYTAGADIAITPRLTIAGDIVGRVVKNSAGLTFTDAGSGGGNQYLGSRIEPGSVHKLLGAVGAKFSVGGAWLLTGTVLFPLKDGGIKPAVTPVIGFERAF